MPKIVRFHDTGGAEVLRTARDLDLAPDGLHVVTGHYDRRVRVSKLAAKA